ncbi:hypothetical protein BJ508DRAFT_37691 [Ascobolus immersus RN42]|uniref:SH3 domain-containing protein n=1 Tax=Ascobolus immersus RN42 TaxID=1160509 RepID=A0A3N4IG10_ASCIM|nr:hypothetical protein BJ508DRAFT_37691 [Ascobolus immersus RN42]
MTRPQMIRADTMDLQSRDAPSAQDHSALHSPPPARRDLSQHQQQQQASIKTVNNTSNNTNNNDQVRHELLTGPGGHSNGISYHHQNEYDLQNGESESEMMDTDEEDLMNAEAELSSTSPSIDNEDIDFEFVYALHTFEATVEGQANAVKGDTMVLLDDSNSYWWLVRIVKDSSIGYLPAEHIETPSERLARLNKHRNMDLASTMLGDTVDKPKTSLSGKLLRKGKKPRNVTFTSPFFSIVEYQVEDSEDEDYQSGEEEDGGAEGGDKDQQSQQQQQQTSSEPVTIYSEPDEITPLDTTTTTTAAPLARARSTSTSTPTTTSQPAMGRIMIGNDTVKTISSAEQVKKSLEAERPLENGTGKPGLQLRARGNTDSAFFGDETVKISLTPSVARYQDEEGSSTSSPVATLSGNSSLKELGRGSLDKASKRDDVLSPPPGKGKEKLKKTAVLAGLFSRRRKGRKSDDDDIDAFLHSEKDKKSSESAREAEAAAERERVEAERRKKEEVQRVQAQRALEAKEAEQRREAEVKRRELEGRQRQEAEQRRREAEERRREIEVRERREQEEKVRREAEERARVETAGGGTEKEGGGRGGEEKG